MRLRTLVRSQLAKRSPRLEEAAVKTRWRLRNRDRSVRRGELPGSLGGVLEDLRRDGIAMTTFSEVFGSDALFREADKRVQELYDRHRTDPISAPAAAKPYLTKLLTGSFDLDDVFMRIALHPNVLALGNNYLGMHGLLRAADLWLTGPMRGPAIQTQLWHRDGDDYMNVKIFVFFSDVTAAAGPFCYARRTHPLGDRRDLPERDDHGRSTDEQMAAIVPQSEWIFGVGRPGTVVFADTCGYHKQVKPESEERLLFMAQYVSGTAYVPRAIEIHANGASELSEDQRYAVFERP